MRITISQKPKPVWHLIAALGAYLLSIICISYAVYYTMHNRYSEATFESVLALINYTVAKDFDWSRQ